jgi:Family of unknown function (DUF6502)
LKTKRILRPEIAGRRKRSLEGNVRLASIRALRQLFLPLSEFALDTGVSVAEVNSILREASVLSAASLHIEDAGRVNISGIAATTGLPRGEISRILNSATSATNQASDRYQQPTNRILAAWRLDPRFGTASGRAAQLKIYGRGATFDSLVRSYGRGIPTRAMLDELIRTGAIDVRPSMKIRMNASVSIKPGITQRSVETLGHRAAEVFSGMLSSMTRAHTCLSVQKTSRVRISLTAGNLQQELSKESEKFLVDLKHLLIGTRNRGAGASTTARVRVLVLCQQIKSESRIKKRRPGKVRKNLRRD